MHSVLKKILVRMKANLTENRISEILNQTDNRGASLMHYFAALNMPKQIQLLYKYGADVNVKCTTTNYTPLIIAAARGNE